MPESPHAVGGPPRTVLATVVLSIVLGVLLVVNIPGFLRTPLDCDPILFDMFVRDAGRGAVLYRDMFENNTPGMIGLHAAVRSTLGWSTEAIRVVDVFVVGAAIGLLGWWFFPGRTDLRLLTVILLAQLYLSTAEWCHVQRDVWMLLPVMSALYLRRSLASRLATGRRSFARGMAEGMVWGLAVWIKPHVAVVAVAVWLVAAAWSRSHSARWRFILADAVAVFAGGLSVGAAGIGLMAAFGIWTPYMEHVTGWAWEYYQGGLHQIFDPWLARLGIVFRNAPGSIFYVVMLPVAVVSAAGPIGAMIRGRRAAGRLDSVLLAAALVGWALQAWCFQQIFDYVHIGGIMLAVALFAGWVWDLPATLRTIAIGTLIAVFGLDHLEPFRNRALTWSESLHSDNPELQDRLIQTGIGRIRWAEVGRVSEFLRSQGVTEGEVAVLSDTAIPIWEQTGLRPPTRFYIIHNNLLAYPSRRAEILSALEANHSQRYLVCDLSILRWAKPPEGCEEKPVEEWPLPAEWHGPRRWADRVVFRSGRYLVLEMAAAEVQGWMADIDYFRMPERMDVPTFFRLLAQQWEESGQSDSEPTRGEVR